MGALNATSGSVFNVAAGTTVGALTKTGDGVFGLDAKVPVAGPVRVLGGTLRLLQAKRGLWEGVRVYANNDELYRAITAAPVFADAITDDFHFMHTWFHTTDAVPTSRWDFETYVTYSGYIWNTADAARTWWFGALLDDASRIFIDDVCVVSQSGYSTPAFAKVTVAPGPHRIVIVLANYTGGAGATGCTDIGWPKGHAVVWRADCDPDAEPSTAYADYYDIADPVHGATLTGTPLLTNDGLPAAPAVEVAAGRRWTRATGCTRSRRTRGSGT